MRKFLVLFVFTHCAANIFGQLSVKAGSKEWLTLNPYTDSIAGISLPEAYLLLKGRSSKTVIVAIIDNGVDIKHEDLINSIWKNTKEIPGNGIDDDHNGYIDDVNGWNFRGSRDGTIIENEQSGSTQFYLRWKHKFEGADSNHLSQFEQERYKIYLRAKNDFW